LLFGKEEDAEAEVLSSEDVKEGSSQSRDKKSSTHTHKKSKSTHFFRIKKGDVKKRTQSKIGVYTYLYTKSKREETQHHRIYKGE